MLRLSVVISCFAIGFVLFLGGCSALGDTLSPPFDPLDIVGSEDLVGRFLFEAGARNTAPGEGFRCAPVESQTTADRFGEPESAYAFGTGSSLDCGDVFNDVSLPYSLALWVRPRTVEGNQTLFMTDFNEAGAPYHGLRIKILDGAVDTFFGDGTHAGVSGRRGTTSEAVLSAGAWVHIAAVVETRDHMRLYVNDKQVRSNLSGFGGTMAHNAGPARFGVGTTNADLDDVYLFERALTTTEIAAFATHAP